MFEPVKLKWKGGDVTIPANRVLKGIAVCETHLTMTEIEQYAVGRQTIPFAKISCAYAAVLAYAGVAVTGEEVYEALLAPEGAETTQQLILDALFSLQALMLPPKVMARTQAAADVAGKDGAVPTTANQEPSRSSTSSSSPTRKARALSRKSSGVSRR